MCFYDLYFVSFCPFRALAYTTLDRLLQFFFYNLSNDLPPPAFPQIDIIGAMVIVWRARGKITRSVLCSIVCNSCTQ